MCSGIVAWNVVGQLCLAPWLAVLLFPLFGLFLVLAVIFGQTLVIRAREKHDKNPGIFWTIILALTILFLILIQLIGTIVSVVGIIIIAGAILSAITGKK